MDLPLGKSEGLGTEEWMESLWYPLAPDGGLVITADVWRAARCTLYPR